MHTMESQSIKLYDVIFLIVLTNNTLQKQQQKTQTHLFLQWGLVTVTEIKKKHL